MQVVLIASGAYVEAELEAEFGRLPPAFLPLGNRRLYAHQLVALQGLGERKLLSVPEDFEPDATDLRWLDAAGVELVPVPPDLTLGQSLVYVVNLTGTVGRPLAILYGDTLLHGFGASAAEPILADLATVSHAPPDVYQWGNVVDIDGRLSLVAEAPAAARQRAVPGGGRAAVLTGFFNFADTALLVQTVTRRGGDFLAGLADYAARRDMGARVAAQWFDFGHAATYHRSRRYVSTAREFNRVVADRRSVTKSGTRPNKINAEACWFEQLPPPLRIHTPAYLGRPNSGEAAYALEYLNIPTLADLYVFGRLQSRTWEHIFRACDEFLSACAAHTSPPDLASRLSDEAAGLYLDKTLARLEEYARASGLPLNEPCRFGGLWLPSIERMARMAAGAIPAPTPLGITLVHGDFCFSNILYDMRGDLVKVIDPRGQDAAGAPCIYGDLRYDIGKLHHSAVGQYDHIIAGAYRIERGGPLDFTLDLPKSEAIGGVAAAYLAHGFARLTPLAAAAPAISVLLFLSMLPLHADDPGRQIALLANAMRLFIAFDAESRAAA